MRSWAVRYVVDDDGSPTAGVGYRVWLRGPEYMDAATNITLWAWRRVAIVPYVLSMNFIDSMFGTRVDAVHAALLLHGEVVEVGW